MSFPLPLARFRPRLIDALQGYDRARFARDFAAGLTVAVVALPLAMAFAIASGLKPEAGLFTAIIAGFLISALGGSRVQIGGPAGAFIVIVYGIVQQYGVGNLIIATALSGVLLFLMGLFKLGTLVRFIPISVIIGFTNGIAVLIALSQVKDFLGLSIPKMPGDFFGILGALWGHLHTLNPWALGVALVSLAVIIGWQRWLPSLGPKVQFSGKLSTVPGSIVALVVGGGLGGIQGDLGERLGARLLFHEADRVLRVRGFPEGAGHAVGLALQAGAAQHIDDGPVPGHRGHDHQGQQHDPGDDEFAGLVDHFADHVLEAHLRQGIRGVGAPGGGGEKGFLQHDAYLYISVD